MTGLEERARTADVAVRRWRCDGEPADPEIEPGYELVLVRRGAFRREIDEGIALVDPTTAYVARPGQWQQIHHVDGRGDAAHLVTFSPRLIGDDAERLPTHPVRITRAVDLAVRRLAAASGTPNALAVDEAVARTLGSLFVGADAAPPAPSPSRRAAVDAIRERLTHEVDSASGSASLADLAAGVGYSPHHLSRVFAAVTGTTIARHRRSLRVRRAVLRIEDGAADLSAVAADAGFADHSHLVRSVRAELGLTPTQLRRWLAA